MRPSNYDFNDKKYSCSRQVMEKISEQINIYGNLSITIY